jgi:acylglycerol lipase
MIPSPSTSTQAGIEEASIRGNDGESLVGFHWAPITRAQSVVVLVHGLKDHTRRYAELAGELVSRGNAVIGFDLRGHGRSSGPRAWVRWFDDYLSDLGVAVGEARRRHPESPLVLFGHSMGGAIVTLFSLDHPEQVQGLVLSAPAVRPGGNVGAATIAFTKFLGTVAPHAAIFRLPDADFSRDPTVVAANVADPLISHRPAPARTAAQLLGAMERIRHRAGELPLPLLVLHGTADRITDPSGSQELVRNAGSRDKNLLLYPGLFHDLLHEPERGTVITDLVAWLDTRFP